LTFRTARTWARFGTERTDVSVDVAQYKVIILHTRTIGDFGSEQDGFKGAGKEIEDSHSKRAKARERAHLHELELSPAFMSPLSNEVLFE
jgi:hypothetical protein